MSKTKNIKDANVLLLRLEGTAPIGLRVIAGPGEKDLFEAVLLTWGFDDGPVVCLEERSLVFYGDMGGVETGSKGAIKLSDDCWAAISRLFGDGRSEIYDSRGWKAFPLTDGMPGVNLISPVGINLLMHILEVVMP